MKAINSFNYLLFPKKNHNLRRDLVNYYKSQYSMKIKDENHPLIKIERLPKKVLMIK